MSRVGKKVLTLPANVTLDVRDNAVVAKGPKGELTLVLPPLVNVVQSDAGITVTVPTPTLKEHRSLWGTFAALLGNVITGVSEGFTKELSIHGVGYTWSASGKKLTIKAGYSHPVVLDIPDGLTLTIGEENVLTIVGCDKEKIGTFAAIIREVRKPEPYKGKGITLRGEHIRRKAGKQSATAA